MEGILGHVSKGHISVSRALVGGQLKHGKPAAAKHVAAPSQIYAMWSMFMFLNIEFPKNNLLIAGSGFSLRNEIIRPDWF